jgi:hypothetical protein
MANKIQLRRDTTANWENVNPILADGEPGLDITTNQVKYGDGANAWVDLSYASGGAGLTDVDGVVTFPGDLLIGTLWPNDPMPEGDKESVVWAKDDTEYLGLWWGGDQTYPTEGYGPVAGIMIGAYEDMTDDFTGDPSPADTNITIAINDSTGTTLAWVFDRTGNLTLPEGSTITDTASAPGTGNGQAIEITPGGASNVNQLLKIYPTAANPDGNHLHLTSGDLSVTDLFLGDDDQFVQIAADGNVCIGTYGTSGNIWQFDNTGNLTLPAGGEIKSAAGVGNVVVQSNDGVTAYNWTFETNGNLTFPDTTTQSTAYTRTTGSWTVATGSATYSFTVPSNGTYSMWVKGNIPSGIIVWNATATVTNSNVPVIGQQFAWNYTGGGTPIEITAIPTQFVGTANTIVSSNPSVGTTSNKFDFVINNTSGSAKTVYWGYVTQ